MLQTVYDVIKTIVHDYGAAGVTVGMFLESSVVPLPSEVVLITAGYFGIEPLTASVFSAIGSTLGSYVGWVMGRFGGRPLVDKWGKYLLINESRLRRAEGWFDRWGGAAILIARLIPFIPFKVFSIAAGVLQLPLKKFMFYTFLGAIPRSYLLLLYGSILLRLDIGLSLLTLALIGIGAGFYLRKWRI